MKDKLKDKFLNDCKQMCVENTGGTPSFQIGENAYISLSCYNAGGGNKELTISNGQSNPTHIVYRSSNFLDNTSYLKVDYELSTVQGHTGEGANINKYANKVIMESDSSLTFDYILKKACEEFKHVTFMNVYKQVLQEFEAMQEPYPELCYQKEA